MFSQFKEIKYLFIFVLILFNPTPFYSMQEKHPLDKLRTGEIATIETIESSQLPAKFFELGFYPGSRIQIKHKAPFGGPICVSILENNALVAIRHTRAHN